MIAWIIPYHTIKWHAFEIDRLAAAAGCNESPWYCDGCQRSNERGRYRMPQFEWTKKVDLINHATESLQGRAMDQIEEDDQSRGERLGFAGTTGNGWRCTSEVVMMQRCEIGNWKSLNINQNHPLRKGQPGFTNCRHSRQFFGGVLHFWALCLGFLKVGVTCAEVFASAPCCCHLSHRDSAPRFSQSSVLTVKA